MSPARVQHQVARSFVLWWGIMPLPAFCIKQDSQGLHILLASSQLGHAILCSIRGLPASRSRLEGSEGSLQRWPPATRPFLQVPEAFHQEAESPENGWAL